MSSFPKHNFAPYESPIEQILGDNLLKYIHDDAKLDEQFHMETIAGIFRADLMIKRGNKRVAIECDGSEYHNEERDIARDAFILGAEAVDVIYRFSGSEIMQSVEAVILKIASEDPELFSESGLWNLNHLIKHQAPPKFHYCFTYREAALSKVKRPIWWDIFAHGVRLRGQYRWLEEFLTIRDAERHRELKTGWIPVKPPCEMCGNDITSSGVRVLRSKVTCDHCYNRHARHVRTSSEGMP